jgi:hypothetical protein
MSQSEVQNLQFWTGDPESHTSVLKNSLLAVLANDAARTLSDAWVTGAFLSAPSNQTLYCVTENMSLASTNVQQ